MFTAVKARHTDRQESHDAAKGVKRGKIKQLIIDFTDFVRSKGPFGATPHEFSISLFPVNSRDCGELYSDAQRISSMCLELVDSGLARKGYKGAMQAVMMHQDFAPQLELDLQPT